ncbi:MAG: phosphomannomutase/phosphoglucomutase, partial [Firmicutes bacterium]|nr:phosphomannomutase/phosphoglucomutase [Bacillota bacterium]
MKNLLDWKKLKSGSDIRGVVDIDNGNIICNETAKKIAIAFSIFLKNNKNIEISDQKISIGHDSRLSGIRFKDIFINSLASIGVYVYDCSLCSTPAISMATEILSCCASVEITASHHPKEYNGFKFFTAEGGLKSKDIEKIIEIAYEFDFPKTNSKGNVRKINLMDKYCEFLKGLFIKSLGDDRPLQGTRIIVNALNGVGGFFVYKVLDKLGADTYGSISLEPDGNFPECHPNPENEKAIENTKKAIKDNNADLGIIFDADVDRSFFIDGNGNEITKDMLVALVSKIILKEYPNSVIVTDSVTSDNLKLFIEKNSGFQFREKRGYQNVISAAKKLNEIGQPCYIAIETSGHAAFKENFFRDDGSYLAVKIIIEMIKLKVDNKQIIDLCEGFKSAEETKEIRIKTKSRDPEKEISKIIRKIENYYKKIPNCKIDSETPEGIRLIFDESNHNGWCLIRKSAHDPDIVLNIESYKKNGVLKIFSEIENIIKPV